MVNTHLTSIEHHFKGHVLSYSRVVLDTYSPERKFDTLPLFPLYILLLSVWLYIPLQNPNSEFGKQFLDSHSGEFIHPTKGKLVTYLRQVSAHSMQPKIIIG